MKNKRELLLSIYREPGLAKTLSLTDWDLLIRQARGSNMLGRLSWIIEQEGHKLDVFTEVLKHLNSARQLSLGHERSVRWEISQLCHAFNPLKTPVILLKGAAYLVRGMDFSRGRIFNDIDLLVDNDQLQNIESTLLLHGWTTTHKDPYDQKYFREWMHELPPLKHIHRQSVLDVHHTILPITAQLKPDIEKIFADIEPVDGYDQVFTLSPLDMVLHSAAHLFHEGEFNNGFRGLCDLDGLLRYYSSDIENFWDRLIQRAIDLDLKKPLYYALLYTKDLLGTPVPAAVYAEIGKGVPSSLGAAMMSLLFHRALYPYHYSCDRMFSSTARWLLYVRSHYIKMPLKLLIPHLFRKAFISEKKA